MGEPTEDQNNPATSNDETGDPDFDFETWAIEAGLVRKTTAKLRQEDLCAERTLALLDSSDIRKLSLAIGQRKLLEAAIQRLTTQVTDQQMPFTAIDEATQIQEENGVTTGGATNHAVETDNGNDPQPPQQLTISQLRRQMQNDNQLEGAGKTLDSLGISPPTSNDKCINKSKSSWSDCAFDPRTMLTIKASSAKAVHITQFLSEATKKKRLARKRQFVVSQKGGDSQLVIATDDDHPYSGLTIEEWSAANCRVMAHLLQTGQLATADIEFYLAYTVQIYEFSQRYQWEGLMDFDYQYRERQAQYNFFWGTNTGNMELSLLNPISR